MQKKRICEVGSYHELAYRICYGLTSDGKMNYSTPHYEFVKYCNCHTCKKRFGYSREYAESIRDTALQNSLTVSTDNMDLFPEIEKILNEYSCGEKKYIGRQFLAMFNGTITQKVIKLGKEKA